MLNIKQTKTIILFDAATYSIVNLRLV